METRTTGAGSSRASNSGEHRSPEEKILKSYFISLSEFKFELARDTSDRERDKRPGFKSRSNWCEFMSVLSRLVNAEVSYFSLNIVERYTLSRKVRKEHTLKTTYEILEAELQKVREVYHLGKGGSDFSCERKLAEAIVSIVEYVSARKDMLDFYLTFDHTDGCHFEYAKMEESLKKMSERSKNGFQHSLLKPIRSMFQKELGTMMELLGTQCHISNWQFLPAILSIQSCETRLSNWHGVIPFDTEGMEKRHIQRSIKSRPYMPSSPSPIPYLYKWWCKLHLTLLSKFSLYFHGVLSEHACVYDMKFLSDKLDTDYIASFLWLIRNTTASCVCLVFDSTGLPEFKGPKYRLPDTPPLALTGINSYPFMIQVPHDFDFHHHRANIVSLLIEKNHQLNTSTQHVSQYDEHLRCTYHMTQLEPRVTMVVLVSSSRGPKDRDTKVTGWISEVATQLRNTFVASLLRPG